MSYKANDKFASTFYNQQRKKHVRTPPKVEPGLRRHQKSYDHKKRASQAHGFQEIAMQQKDERFKYLLKNGEIKKVEKSGNIIFAQLPQIPNVWVCYRRPCERETNLEKLSLDSLQLGHIPLLEGEQKLKMLTFQHNRIAKVENLISLPNLLYIDLYDNQIRELENLAVATLKVLLIPKNNLTRIRGLAELPRLEVLDLHSNKLTRIEGLGVLHSLRILNLSHNSISRIENLDGLQSLCQCNLKGNAITSIENLLPLQKLEKLYLANNKIADIRNLETCDLLKLPCLKDLTFEGNPVAIKKELMYNLLKLLPQLKTLDGKPPTMDHEDLLSDDQDTGQGDADHEEVMSTIAAEWEQEKMRVRQIQDLGGSKKEYLKSTCIAAGHAEIEDESVLFIYGNSYDVVLSKPEFQETVEKIRFEFMFIEFLLDAPMLATLRKFKKLRVVEFRECFIMSLLQIAKLENLSALRVINIDPAGNPICSCTFLKEFVIYRFPAIVQINHEDVKENDRVKAKTLFQNFDRVLQIPEKVFGLDMMRLYPSEDPDLKRDRNYLKIFNKALTEVADATVDGITHKTEDTLLLKKSLELFFDNAMLHLIKKTKLKHLPDRSA